MGPGMSRSEDDSDETDPSIVERVRIHSAKVRPSPVSDLKVPLSEVWSNRAPPPIPPKATESEPEEEIGPTTLPQPGYWDSPLLTPPDPRCGNCQLENPPESRYCAKCGLPLEPPPRMS